MADIAKHQMSQSKKNKLYYSLGPGRTERNKIRKLKRQIRWFPNDLQAAKRLAELSSPFERMKASGRI